MPGIDKLVAPHLALSIKQNAEEKFLREFERKMFLTYGMSIKLAIEHMEKLSALLGQIADFDGKKFIKECLNEIIIIQKNEKNFEVEIIEPKLIEKILLCWGDEECRKIIILLMGNSYTIPEILQNTNIPKTSGYRKIEELMSLGLIIEVGRTLSESKKVSKFSCVFDEMIITINKNSTQIIGKISPKIFDKSSLVSILSF
jgi:hypothetical protein